MMSNPGTLLRQLERVRDQFGDGAATAKVALLRTLARRSLRTAEQVLRLHETLCFVRAYPDNADVLTRAETLLARFHRRGDLRDHADELMDSGIAGTDIYLRFCWETMDWLEQHFPERITIDWEESDPTDQLSVDLPWLLPFAESPGIDELPYSAREWLDLLRSRAETDAAFLVRRTRHFVADEFGRAAAYQRLQMMVRLESAPGTPARTRGRLDSTDVHFQTTPFVRGRPDLHEEIARPPHAIRRLTGAEGQAIIDLTRGQMIPRHRNLYMFSHADPDDVFLVDCGDGLVFAAMGTKVARRLVLETSYGFLTLKNGVPIGYVLASSLFGSTEVAYNVFETFRGGEAARVFGSVIAMIVQLFGSDVCSVDPYQLGHDNQEGLESGAWWFYYKLGFRPLDPDVKQLVAQELARMQRNPAHRSSLETLHELSAAHMYWFVHDERDDVLGQLPIGFIGERVSRYLGHRFGADREAGLAICAKEAAQRLGVRLPRSENERIAWERWAPIVMLLPGVARWSRADRRSLAAVIRAKGGQRESEYIKRFNAHPRLHKALARLASSPEEG